LLKAVQAAVARQQHGLIALQHDPILIKSLAPLGAALTRPAHRRRENYNSAAARHMRRLT
jgi:hypothetical protein